jgi:hypothetical protein
MHLHPDSNYPSRGIFSPILFSYISDTIEKMKSLRHLALLPALLVLNSVSAQQDKMLKKTIELKIPREGGANGAGVAWHPGLKTYYAAIAGNTSFFMGVYDNKGKLLSPVEQQTYFDIRGLWYNSKTKAIQANGYNDNGWAEYVLDKSGMPTDLKIIHDEMNQPGAQSVGAYDSKTDAVLFLNDEGFLERFDMADGRYVDNTELKLGTNAGESNNSLVLANYNTSTAVYTGISGAEVGLLNHASRRIELYDLNSGFMVKTLTLPDEASVPQFLNFAYSNGLYWLFDKTERIWVGYK